jgi:FHS family L-fucose permease-like MFS transporter
MTVLGPPQYASFRLTLAQGFNGIATVIGPLIASKTFFDENEPPGSIGAVQYVYLAMSVFGVILNVLLIFAKLPEVSQVVAADASETTTIKGFLKKKHTIYGFLAEFGYVGAQVAVASNTIFYLRDAPEATRITEAEASNLFSACQAVFTVGRFIGVGYLRFIDPCFALFVNGVGLVLFSILTSTIRGKGEHGLESCVIPPL